MKYWVIQQSTNYFVVASVTPPNLEVPEGVKRKVMRGMFLSDAQARTKAQSLAAEFHGTYVP